MSTYAPELYPAYPIPQAIHSEVLDQHSAGNIGTTWWLPPVRFLLNAVRNQLLSVSVLLSASFVIAFVVYWLDQAQ